MASGTRLREAGLRKPQKKRASGVLAGGLQLADGNAGESRLNMEQIYSIEHLFQSHPAVHAARSVLHGQLLSGGVSLKKDGVDVELTPVFKRHLSDTWLPFAGDVIDSFLKWGVCVVAYEEEADRTRSLLRTRVKKELDGKKARAAQWAKDHVPALLIPIVPPLGSYEVAYRMGGRAGYRREYLVYSTSATHAHREDEEARVVVRQHPDATGNVSSPMAAVFELGSFVGALNELAVVAEASRARPRFTTQMRKKDANSLDPANLFFDSDSRAVQAGVDDSESAQAARALQMQQGLCDVINRLQTRKDGHDTHSFSGAGRPGGYSGYTPYEGKPQLFCLPKDQELAPHGQDPESRGDLEGLQRLAMEQFSAAMGVPADLIFSGRFAGKSTSQLSLLNTSVSQLAKSVNGVLSLAYRDIYAIASGEDVGQLQLLTSPISSTEEVLQLYNGGLVPAEIAVPSVLHAIGASKEEIDAAVTRVVAERDEKERRDKQDRERADQLHELGVSERRAGGALLAPSKDGTRQGATAHSGEDAG